MTRRDLNRFRLVLVADRPAEVRKTAERQFEELRGNDEKVHLHVIGNQQFIFTAVDAEGKADGMRGRG